jgi:hypothetical protein
MASQAFLFVTNKASGVFMDFILIASVANFGFWVFLGKISRQASPSETLNPVISPHGDLLYKFPWLALQTDAVGRDAGVMGAQITFVVALGTTMPGLGPVRVIAGEPPLIVMPLTVRTNGARFYALEPPGVCIFVEFEMGWVFATRTIVFCRTFALAAGSITGFAFLFFWDICQRPVIPKWRRRCVANTSIAEGVEDLWGGAMGAIACGWPCALAAFCMACLAAFSIRTVDVSVFPRLASLLSDFAGHVLEVEFSVHATGTALIIAGSITGLALLMAFQACLTNCEFFSVRNHLWGGFMRPVFTRRAHFFAVTTTGIKFITEHAF